MFEKIFRRNKQETTDPDEGLNNDEKLKRRLNEQWENRGQKPEISAEQLNEEEEGELADLRAKLERIYNNEPIPMHEKMDTFDRFNQLSDQKEAYEAGQQERDERQKLGKYYDEYKQINQILADFMDKKIPRPDNYDEINQRSKDLYNQYLA